MRSGPLPVNHIARCEYRDMALEERRRQPAGRRSRAQARSSRTSTGVSLTVPRRRRNVSRSDGASHGKARLRWNSTVGVGGGESVEGERFVVAAPHLGDAERGRTGREAREDRAAHLDLEHQEIRRRVALEVDGAPAHTPLVRNPVALVRLEATAPAPRAGTS